jgi:lysyl-tRNA synthetase class 2
VPTAGDDLDGESTGGLIAGRVVACPAPDVAVVLEGPRRVTVRGPVAHLAPGDLVRIHVESTADPTRELAVLGAELVFRPLRAPWAPGTETAALMGEGLRDRLVLRARVLAALRAHFARGGYLEVETPAIATSPGLDLHLHAYAVQHATPAEPGPDESGKRASFPPAPLKPFGYLITSPEYHMKRLLVGGVPRCFQVARCFRAGELGRSHEPEFTMVEWYRAWAGFEDLLADTEALVRAAASAGPTPGSLVVGDARVRLDRPFERLTVREAFARFAPGQGDPLMLAARDEERFYRVLIELVEPHLGQERPTFLTRYPASQASLARIAPDDPTVCERVELYVGGLELSNGFVELTDPFEQRMRLERDERERAARGLPVYPIDERFLRALEEGLPPSVGNAVGLDRLVAMVCGRAAVADVMAFPHRRR